MNYALRPTHIENSESSFENLLYIYGELRTIDSLRDPFSDTLHAHRLRNLNPRFSKSYPWDDKAKFLELFGMDVDPYEHGPYQARTVAIPLAERQDNLITRDKALLIGYTVIHDDHEGTHAFNLGRTEDVPKMMQTHSNEVAEFTLWENIQRSIYGGSKVKNDIERITDFGGPDAPPSDMRLYWDTTEKLSYFLTAMRSWDIFNNHENLTKLEREQSCNMAIIVALRHLEDGLRPGDVGLEEARRKVVFADDVLLGLSGQIAEIKRARGDK